MNSHTKKRCCLTRFCNAVTFFLKLSRFANSISSTGGKYGSINFSGRDGIAEPIFPKFKREDRRRPVDGEMRKWINYTMVEVASDSQVIGRFRSGDYLIRQVIPLPILAGLGSEIRISATSDTLPFDTGTEDERELQKNRLPAVMASTPARISGQFLWPANTPLPRPDA